MATQINYKQIKAEADLYKYQIVPSISSWNLTVALKNYLWQNNSLTTPIKSQIWDTVRTITSPLSATRNAWSNWFNMWSSELATKEVDLFVYLAYDTALSQTWLLISRLPGATKYWDFSTSWTNEKGIVASTNINPASTDRVINIGRFSAILSAGAWYTWSTPSAWFQVINYPIFNTKKLEYTAQIIWTWWWNASSVVLDCFYKIIWTQCYLTMTWSFTKNTLTWRPRVTIPINSFNLWENITTALLWWMNTRNNTQLLDPMLNNDSNYIEWLNWIWTAWDWNTLPTNLYLKVSNNYSII